MLMLKARGSMGRRLFAKALWSSRRQAAAFAGVGLAWGGLSWLVWLAMSALGIGADWSPLRMFISCFGAVSEMALALCVPLAASVDDVDPSTPYGSYYGAMGDEGGGGRSAPSPDSIKVAMLIGLAMAGLDAARLLAPWLGSAPSWLCSLAAGWWLLVDLFCAGLIGVGLLATAAIGAMGIWRSSTQVDLLGWANAECEELGSACGKASKVGSGSTRRL